MENMMRNDSTSIISSLQMDYGDSDDEDTEKRSASKDIIVIESVSVTADVSVTAEYVTSGSEIEKPVEQSRDISANGLGKEEASLNGTSQIDEETEDLEKEHDPEGESEVRPDELISDDEDGEHPHRHSRVQPDKDAMRIQAVFESVKTESPSSVGSTNPGRKAARLVSYGPDEDLDEDDSSDSYETKDFFSEDGTTASPELNNVDTSILTRSVQNMASDDIKIPPEPTGKCPYQLQKKIEDMYDRMRREGLDLNRTIQSKKNFRNPSIYEKLIDFCRIDEKGTNFPPEIYDPHIWGKESLYDELDKVQRKDMERREKEKKKAPIEFVMGTKKPATAADSLTGQPDEKKRKTKWDTQPAAVIHVSKIPSANQNPGIVNLTAVATGTKNTVIPAVGSLSKKSSLSGK